jgi:hypothetical protein
MRLKVRRVFALTGAALLGVALSACSDSTTEPTTQLPSAPNSVTASSTGTTSIRVVWDQVSAATSY